MERGHQSIKTQPIPTDERRQKDRNNMNQKRTDKHKSQSNYIDCASFGA